MARSKKEYAEWIAIRDRTHKRVWTKISHPRSNKEILSAKEQKEEKEYLEAFAEEQKLRAEKRALEDQVGSMEDEVSLRFFVVICVADVLGVDQESVVACEGTYEASE
jgi:hypothetical protein